MDAMLQKALIEYVAPLPVALALSLTFTSAKTMKIKAMTVHPQL